MTDSDEIIWIIKKNKRVFPNKRQKHYSLFLIKKSLMEKSSLKAYTTYDTITIINNPLDTGHLNPKKK